MHFRRQPRGRDVQKINVIGEHFVDSKRALSLAGLDLGEGAPDKGQRNTTRASIDLGSHGSGSGSDGPVQAHFRRVEVPLRRMAAWHCGGGGQGCTQRTTKTSTPPLRTFLPAILTSSTKWLPSLSRRTSGSLLHPRVHPRGPLHFIGGVDSKCEFQLPGKKSYWLCTSGCAG